MAQLGLKLEFGLEGYSRKIGAGTSMSYAKAPQTIQYKGRPGQTRTRS